jgi:hypothetical protein
MEAIANHIQKEYKGGPEIVKVIRELSLPMVPSPNYLTANLGGMIDPGEVFLWQQKSKKPRRESSCLLQLLVAN